MRAHLSEFFDYLRGHERWAIGIIAAILVLALFLPVGNIVSGMGVGGLGAGFGWLAWWFSHTKLWVISVILVILAIRLIRLAPDAPAGATAADQAAARERRNRYYWWSAVIIVLVVIANAMTALDENARNAPSAGTPAASVAGVTSAEMAAGIDRIHRTYRVDDRQTNPMDLSFTGWTKAVFSNSSKVALCLEYGTTATPQRDDIFVKIVDPATGAFRDVRKGEKPTASTWYYKLKPGELQQDLWAVQQTCP